MSCSTVHCVVLFALIFLVSGAPDKFPLVNWSKDGGYWRLVESAMKYLKERPGTPDQPQLASDMTVTKIQEATMQQGEPGHTVHTIFCQVSLPRSHFEIVMDWSPSAKTLQLKSADLQLHYGGEWGTHYVHYLEAPILHPSGAPDKPPLVDWSKDGGYWQLVESTMEYLKQRPLTADQPQLSSDMKVERIKGAEMREKGEPGHTVHTILCETSVRTIFDTKRIFEIIMDWSPEAKTLQLRSANFWGVDYLKAPIDVDWETFNRLRKIQAKPIQSVGDDDADQSNAHAKGKQESEEEGQVRPIQSEPIQSVVDADADRSNAPEKDKQKAPEEEGQVEEGGKDVGSGLSAPTVVLLIVMVAAAAGGLFFWKRAKQTPRALSGGLEPRAY